jgi:hypothetical protein
MAFGVNAPVTQQVESSLIATARAFGGSALVTEMAGSSAVAKSIQLLGILIIV